MPDRTEAVTICMMAAAMKQFVQEELDHVRRIVLRGLCGRRARVYLFGSRARGNEMRWSDVDVAVEPLEPLPEGLLSDIREALEESRVVYAVDLVDLSTAGAAFRRQVGREGIAWTS